MPAVSVLIAMALYRYFQTSDKSTTLPDPRGPLSRLAPSSSIASANEKVKDLWTNEERTSGRKGVQKLPDHVLKESSVRTWRNAYTREMQTRRRKGGDMTVTHMDVVLKTFVFVKHVAAAIANL